MQGGGVVVITICGLVFAPAVAAGLIPSTLPQDLEGALSLAADALLLVKLGSIAVAALTLAISHETGR
jgi:hypothetical protein